MKMAEQLYSDFRFHDCFLNSSLCRSMQVIESFKRYIFGLLILVCFMQTTDQYIFSRKYADT